MRIPITGTNRRLSLLTWLAVIGIVLWGLGATSASGQGGPFHDRTMTALEKTDQIIDRARDAVNESGSKKGEMLLEEALHFQQNARDHVHQRQYGQAAGVTLKAREKALEAIAATRSPEENENAVRLQLERTDQILQDAREGIRARISGPENGPTPRLDFWLEQQQTAWQQFHERRLRSALKLTLQVRGQISRVAERVRRRHGPMNIEQSLQRLHEYIDRVRGPITASGVGKNLEMLERAERRLAQADEASAAGQVSVADEHAKICRELLDRATAGIEQNIDAQQVDELIAQARAEWDRLEGAVIDAGDASIRQLHERAGLELRRAEATADAGDLAEALAQTRAATNLLNDIRERLP